MCLKVVPTMGKEKKSGQKQSKQKPSPSQGVGMVTPRDGNNVPKRASSPTSGHTSALEESIVKYKKRVTKLEIENEDLRIDVRTLHTDKSLIYCTVSQNYRPNMGKSLAGWKSLNSSIKRNRRYLEARVATRLPI